MQKIVISRSERATIIINRRPRNRRIAEVGVTVHIRTSLLRNVAARRFKSIVIAMLTDTVHRHRWGRSIVAAVIVASCN